MQKVEPVIILPPDKENWLEDLEGQSAMQLPADIENWGDDLEEPSAVRQPAFRKFVPTNFVRHNKKYIAWRRACRSSSPSEEIVDLDPHLKRPEPVRLGELLDKEITRLSNLHLSSGKQAKKAERKNKRRQVEAASCSTTMLPFPAEQTESTSQPQQQEPIATWKWELPLWALPL